MEQATSERDKVVSPYDHLTGSRKSELPTKHIAGGYSRFQVTRMVEGFVSFGFEIFDFGIFLVA